MMMTNKFIKISLLLFVIFLLPLFASEENVHNGQLLQVLFGRPYTINEIEERNIKPLENALYWCLDEFNGTSYKNGIALQRLKDLKRFGVKNVPAFEKIDFTAGSEHQRYTHRGWDWIDYPENIRGYNFKEIWRLRKQLLFSTVDKVFNFKRDETIKCESLSAILYYVHILGDHIGDSKRTYMDRIPLSPRPDYRFNRSGENSNNPTVYTELLYHLPRLFREQTNSVNYRMLSLYLDHNKNREFPTGTTISDQEYAELQSFSKETLDKLIEYIPRLLRNENFFMRVFQ
jgi:hypothetical protein